MRILYTLCYKLMNVRLYRSQRSNASNKKCLSTSGVRKETIARIESYIERESFKYH